jgi:ferredoxin--NADP+ reductase
MYKIINSRVLGTGIKQFEIEAPRIARKQQPGQFVIVRLHEHGERIPLTIKGSDPERGTVTIVVQAIGKTTHLFNMLETGDAILDIVGPLGHPSEIKNYGTVVLVAGSVGTAMAFPTAVALKKAGNEVIVIEGARRKDLIVLEDEVRAELDQFYVMTDDGSHGEQGLVTKKLEEVLTSSKVDFVLACGPVPMMRAIKDMTLPRGIRTMVSLNSIMVDGTGMCGGCRVLVGNTSKFACVDGPEFDADMVNFDVLSQRNAAYRDKEKQSLDTFLADPSRDLALVKKNLETTEPCAAVAGGSNAR